MSSCSARKRLCGRSISGRSWKFDDATFPSIAVPTITFEGDANGAPHPDLAAYARRFTGKYQHRLFEGGIGQRPPQEAPDEFAKAVIDVDRL